MRVRYVASVSYYVAGASYYVIFGGEYVVREVEVTMSSYKIKEQFSSAVKIYG